jgi:hypothetical protein
LPIFLFIILLLFSHSASAIEACSRVAIINYQEILVDSNSSEKGEGLRFHLEKDPVAKEYLDTYQKKSSVLWPSAILGTAGTGLILYGLFNSDVEDQRLFLISGSATLIVNFLVARTLEVTNENNLNRAIEEYNKRNLPKIFFNPEETQSQIDFSKFKVGLAQVWTF